MGVVRSRQLSAIPRNRSKKMDEKTNKVYLNDQSILAMNKGYRNINRARTAKGRRDIQLQSGATDITTAVPNTTLSVQRRKNDVPSVSFEQTEQLVLEMVNKNKMRQNLAQ